jgi:hypothetical protein
MAENTEQTFEFCTELHLEDSASIEAAVSERGDNIVAPDGSAFAPLGLDMIDAPAMAIIYTKLWSPGRTLKISFIGEVDPIVRQKIIDYSSQWLNFANLRFEYVDAGGDIRISTTRGGSWSYVGTDAKGIAANKPTMNYGWLTPTTSEEEFSRVILHEFGHALGAIHEHQHPDAGIPWDKPKVYAYYARQGWNAAQVDNNIFARYSASQLNSTSYDPESIMHYAVPDELTIGNYQVGWNRILSDNDKVLARRCYP